MFLHSSWIAVFHIHWKLWNCIGCSHGDMKLWNPMCAVPSYLEFNFIILLKTCFSFWFFSQWIWVMFYIKKFRLFVWLMHVVGTDWEGKAKLLVSVVEQVVKNEWVTLRFRMSRLKSGSSDEEKSEQTLKISVEVNKFC